MTGDYNRSDIGRFGPLESAHPAVRDAQLCIICRHVFEAGDVPTLIKLAPADEEEARKWFAGLAHTSVAGIAHQECAYPNKSRR